ncbi:MAG: zinc ribbon domain-containing protein [Armatimonadetes bacterium]|nr:zinc ribbon domain-containing protein [Armatimonadota bacterium]MDW8121355.1 zinc ribbon domain-containing protein [Armatimonadota bacterium]
MKEPNIVVCRCGHPTQTEPSPDARCPHCGHRLFRECTCGEIIPRSEPSCPHCGLDWRARRRSRRPRIRLRQLVLYSIGGFLAAWILTVTLIEVLETPAASPGGWSSFGPSRLLLGLVLLVSDAYNFVLTSVREDPPLLIGGLVGLVAAGYYVSKAQQITISRLRRHFKRKLQRWRERRRQPVSAQDRALRR